MAQNSQLGRFSVAYPAACAPVTISIAEHDNFGDISRQYFYEPGLVETPDTFYTYNNPGIYQIIQFLGEDIQPKTDTLIFEVLPNNPPQFEILRCSNTEITVFFPKPVYDYYSIKFSEVDSVVYTQGDNFPHHNYLSNSGTVEVTGFFYNAFPNCSDRSESFNITAYESTRIINAAIEEVCLKSFYLTLQLSVLNSNTLYKVDIDQNGVITNLLTGKIEKDVLHIVINDFNFNEDYCIQISALNACDSSFIDIQSTCPELNIKSNKLSEAYASYFGGGVKIGLNENILGSVNVFRKSENNNYHLIAQTLESLIDYPQSTSRNYEYKLVLLDSCGNKLDSAEIAPPFIRLLDKSYSENILKTSIIEPTNNLKELSKGILFYNKDSTKTEFLDLANEFKLPYTLGSLIRFRLQFQYENTIIIYSNEEFTSYEYLVYLPNTFTPNQDGLNDELELFGIPSQNFEMTIYDRWGSVVHTSSSNPVWNGVFKGKTAEEGSYTYKLIFETENGELKSQVGTFTVLKK